MMLPKYPIYVPSRGRWENNLTAKFLMRDRTPFRLVVEPQEAKLYASRFGEEKILVLPFSNLGLGSIPARNWIKEHATKEGHARHWQLDDNIRRIWRRVDAVRVPCESGVAFRVCEDFVDRYENVAIAGLNYEMFLPDYVPFPPFTLNVHVYSCTLVLNSIPYQWRGRYNEDTDLCLQALSDGWCTVLFNAFVAQKLRTMVMGGGNTNALYLGDGRLKMARALERLWPKVVTTQRRFKRPQHVIHQNWRKFDNELRLKPGIVLENLPPDEYNMRREQA